MSDQAEAIVHGLKILLDALHLIAAETTVERLNSVYLAQKALADYAQAIRNI